MMGLLRSEGLMKDTQGLMKDTQHFLLHDFWSTWLHGQQLKQGGGGGYSSLNVAAMHI